jgi:hypothetical protein
LDLQLCHLNNQNAPPTHHRSLQDLSLVTLKFTHRGDDNSNVCWYIGKSPSLYTA